MIAMVWRERIESAAITTSGRFNGPAGSEFIGSPTVPVSIRVMKSGSIHTRG